MTPIRLAQATILLLALGAVFLIGYGIGRASRPVEVQSALDCTRVDATHVDCFIKPPPGAPT